MNISVRNAEGFAFTPENLKWAETQLAKYPESRKQSAVMPLLQKAQEQNNGWVSVPVMEYIADMLEMPYIRVNEVATFYTMYNLKPVGKHVIEVCTTTPCWLRGSDNVVSACKQELGIGFGETTEDGEFTLLEVECAGACVNAPVIAYKEEYYEDLDDQSTRKFIQAIKSGEVPVPGPQTTDRHKSAPQGGPTTLKEFCATQGGKV
ncbi:NADH-quinone oxidoreductase subunit NuoE [Paremcibacter congregatus]|uniref:NADH-quinone oxidoreductase subunit NuoE n=1 Tax=Paremcibacter congregatus TaxID=2043170 RepID=A0A2G4YSR5_9PROT|nr:NADH-quinone oxidoreductase subunit NuoE [Paremcibacter congregatus]PHZ85317.1 NADH-quinone oxidoreductase subunit NuoE [Paremcibacter congregatus]QDE27751.1 NADH-quinone oxidoreductase subunit NuoE [Paremcibacter congregatus]